MIEKLLRRSTVTYFMLFVVNPIIILCFQNCSVVKLSDLKLKPSKASVSTSTMTSQHSLSK